MSLFRLNRIARYTVFTISTLEGYADEYSRIEAVVFLQTTDEWMRDDRQTGTYQDEIPNTTHNYGIQ